MRKFWPLLVLLLLLAFSLHAQPPSAYVIDQAGWLTSAQRRDLEEILQAFDKAKGWSPRVLTLPALDGEELGLRSDRTLRQWYPDPERRAKSLLYIVSASDGKMRVEIGGELLPYLSHEDAEAILRETVVPRFQKGEYAEGLREGSLGLLNRILQTQSPSPPEKTIPRAAWYGIGLFFGLLLAFILVIVLMGGELTIQSDGRRIYRVQFSDKYSFLVPAIFQGLVLFLKGGFGSGTSGAFKSGGGDFGGGGAVGKW